MSDVRLHREACDSGLRLRERLRERLWERLRERLLRAFGAAGSRSMVLGARSVFFAARLSCCGNCGLVSKVEKAHEKIIISGLAVYLY